MMSYVVPGFLKMFSDTDSITKIVVDDSRNLLYTLTSNGAIEAFDTDEQTTRRIAKLSQHDIALHASNILKYVSTLMYSLFLKFNLIPDIVLEPWTILLSSR